MASESTLLWNLDSESMGLEARRPIRMTRCRAKAATQVAEEARMDPASSLWVAPNQPGALANLEAG
jgi:hypothetical protein